MGRITTAKELAHYTVNKCIDDGQLISNLHLQKMLYLFQFVFCRVTGEFLFDDDFEAWPYGPVVPSVYAEYSRYGGNAITARSDTVNRSSFGYACDFIDAGINELRTRSPWALVNITHAKGSPWDRVYRDGSGYKKEIPKAFIAEAAAKATKTALMMAFPRKSTASRTV